MVDSILPLFYFISFALLLHRLARTDRLKEIIPFLVFAAVGMVLFFYEQADIALLLSTMVAFDVVGMNYGKHDAVFSVILGFLYVIVLQYYVPVVLIAQAMLLGLLAEVWRFRAGEKAKGRIELERDVIQIFVGLFIAAMFFLFRGPLGELGLLLMVLLGYMVGSYSVMEYENSLSRFLHRFEREEASFGQGAAWLALGSLFVISFISNTIFIIPIFFCMYIGDSVATLVGVHFPRPGLPYNDRKGVLGQVAYFAVVAAVSYPFVGGLAVWIALVGTIVESLPLGVDDNFSVPLVLVLLLDFFV